MKIGNVIVGQSGGPTAVINSSLVGVFQTAKKLGAPKIYGMCHGIEGLQREEYIDISEHIRDELDADLLQRTPSSYLGSCRYQLPCALENAVPFEHIFTILEKLKIEIFIYIGGNDSMDTISKLSEYGRAHSSPIRFMGVPKTIDNDLAITDHTPGYGSAAKCIGTLMKEIILDACVYGNRAITLVEIMGRNAGWLTAAAALSRMEDCAGPDLIYVPEVRFDIEAFVDRASSLLETKKSLVIAVSEGLKIDDGRYVCELSEEKIEYQDAFGHRALTGTGRYLSNLLARKLGCKTRSIELSTIQRLASHIVSRTDVTEAHQVGGYAVYMASEGRSGEMVVLERMSNNPYVIGLSTCAVNRVANIEKKLPLSWLTPEQTFVTQDFLTYARPLIQSELTPIMVGGLPRHFYSHKKELN